MLLSTQTRMSGGSSDTDVKELAVRPCASPAWLRIVTMATPVAKCPQAMRNWLASRLTRQEHKSRASTSASDRRGPEVADLGGQPQAALKALHESVGEEDPEPPGLELGLEGDVLAVDHDGVEQPLVRLGDSDRGDG